MITDIDKAIEAAVDQIGTPREELGIWDGNWNAKRVIEIIHTHLDLIVEGIIDELGTQKAHAQCLRGFLNDTEGEYEKEARAGAIAYIEANQ